MDEMFGPGEDPVEEVCVEEELDPVQTDDVPVIPPADPPVVPEAKSEPVMVPLAALHEVRDEVKRLKAEAERVKQPTPEPIDPWTDLEGAFAQRDQQYQQLLFQQKAQFSRRLAEMQHGAETVQAAVEWAHSKCDADPAFNQQVFAADDPVGFAVQQFNRDQIASSMSMDDFKAFQAWKQAQSNPQPMAAPVAQPAPVAVPEPPKSLVSAQSAGAPTKPKTDPVEERLNSMF